MNVFSFNTMNTNYGYSCNSVKGRCVTEAVFRLQTNPFCFSNRIFNTVHTVICK